MWERHVLGGCLKSGPWGNLDGEVRAAARRRAPTLPPLSLVLGPAGRVVRDHNHAVVRGSWPSVRETTAHPGAAVPRYGGR